MEELVTAIEKLQRSHVSPEYATIRMVLNNALAPAVESLEDYDLIDVQEPDLAVYDRMAECAA